MDGSPSSEGEHPERIGAATLPQWLLDARAAYRPHVYPAPGPVQPGDIRVVEPHPTPDDDALRQLVYVTSLDAAAPWTRERPVAGVLLVSAEVELAYDDDYAVSGDVPYAMIVVAQAVGSVWADRLGQLIHRAPEMLAPLAEIVRTGPRGFAGPLAPAGLPIRSSRDPRVAERTARLHRPFAGVLDTGEILAAAECYLESDPDYDGPGVIQI